MNEAMSVSEYAAIKELENEHREGWGSTTALWVIVAALIVFAVVYNWTRGCNEKVQFATSLANLNGRINCLQPKVEAMGEHVYGLAQDYSGSVAQLGCISRRVNNLDQAVFVNPVDDMNRRYYGGQYGDGHRGYRGCGGREFVQTQNYELKDQNVSVTETCGGGCGCH